LIGDLEPQVEHTSDRLRLTEGHSIGSERVEGAFNSAIGHRLYQTGAWRRIRRLERMAPCAASLKATSPVPAE